MENRVVNAITVAVPATTANLGPGFDCLGAALSLCNQFTFSALPPSGSEKLVITVSGLEADRVKTDASNLVYQVFCKLFDSLNQPPPPVQIEIQLGVPLSRGLGSSATAIVGGLVGANVLAGSPLSQAEILRMAVAIEGHPDNVVPALLGGCQLAATGIEHEWEICEIAWNKTIIPVLAIPDFELSTQAARRVLPDSYSRADAIFNTAHLGLLLRGLETGNRAWLRSALQDRIHQPYRQTLIPGYEVVRTAAIDAGALGLVISGAGPTLLALTELETAEAVKLAIKSAWGTAGCNVEVKILEVNTTGALVTLPESGDFAPTH